MSGINFRWHFPSTDNGDEDGINDSLREMFEGNHEWYVARESIQNSIDARKDKNSPVKVRFERKDLPVQQLPGYSELVDILMRAKEYSSNQDKSESFYGLALKILQRPTIPVLKVSDFNTTGLSGDDHDTGGGWYKLIRAQGVNSMSGVGGGSFGIGKGAPFAASGLRTVFYSTINEDGEHAFQGKARISSFRDETNDVRRGNGQYGLAAERGVKSIRNKDEIPEFFRRTEQGTDFFIIGYQTENEDWTEKLLTSLLSNFWLAIHSDELDVELAENGQVLHQVSQENLDELMAEYTSEKGGSYYFYKAVTEPTISVKKVLPMLKDVELYVKTGEGYPKSVQLTRQSKMVVSSIDNYRVLPEPYAAVFICTSDEGNKLLRELEPPAHDKWDPERNKEYGRKVYNEMRDWIKAMLKSLAEDKDIEPEDIPELSQWLPEAEERDDTNPFLGSIGEPADGKSETETAQEVGVERETEATETRTVRQREVSLTKGFARGGNDTPVGTKDRKNKKHGATVDTAQIGNILRINSANIRFRAREVNRNGERIYQAVITASDNERGAIKIMAIGDDSDYPVEIKHVVNDSGQAINYSGALIKDLELKPNQPVKIFITLQEQKRYALGVE